MQRAYSLSLGFILFVLLVGAFLYRPFTPLILPADAATTALNGYVWSDTIGWISMNCTNTGTCGTLPYAVTIDTSTKLLSGYAWSDNIGWVQFGGLASFPSGPNGNALISGNALVGWIKAIGAVPADGWDGWISLSCQNTGTCGTVNYGVNVGFGTMSGYAWGGTVVGWTDWSNVTFTGACTAKYACSADHLSSIATDQWCGTTPTVCAASDICKDVNGLCGLRDPQGTLNITKTKVRKGGTTGLSWNVLYANTCTVSGTNGDTWTPSSSTAVTTSAIQNTTTYTLSCTPVGGGASTLLDTKNVSVVPTIQQF